ncbi:MAG: T9SS type A sorting domain-containing protein [Taibaiella sp.]|nr:T9SS type A sorting domain-containing protein [Taibaiella sp.]
MKYCYFILTSFLLSISVNSFGQLDSCNVFLKGAYLEAGINWNGAYGSSTIAPTGYHPRGSTGVKNATACGGGCPPAGTGLGFVADPDKDGWSIGTPSYYGDYFMTGSPQEGWSIMANGVQANAWNQNGCGTGLLDANISGSNTNFISYGSKRIGVWKGTFKDSLTVRQVTTLDTSALYITVNISLVNISAVTQYNVYYLRTVDPDNAQAIGGTYETRNKVEKQLPNSEGITLISTYGINSSGIVRKAYLGLGSNDCRARGFLINSGLAPIYEHLDTMYNENDLSNYKYRDSMDLDAGIGLVFKLGDIPPGESVNFSYVYILKEAEKSAAFVSPRPGWSVNGIIYNSGDTGITCVNNTIPVSIANGANYNWTWTSQPAGISITPLSPISVDVVTGSSPIKLIATGVGNTCTTTADTIIMYLDPAIPDTTSVIAILGSASVSPGSTVNLYAHVGNTGSSYQIRWKRNGVTISTTTTPSLSYTKGSGNDTITALVISTAPGCYRPGVSNQWIVRDNTLSVTQAGADNAVSIYPNPVMDELTIEHAVKNTTLKIFNMVGTQVLNATISTEKEIISTSSLQPGIYMLQLTDGNGNSIGRVLSKR